MEVIAKLKLGYHFLDHSFTFLKQITETKHQN